MKNRFQVFTLIYSILLVLSAPYLALAKNAASVDVKISYPYDTTNDQPGTEAVAKATDGDVVNVYITLLDEDGNPADAGPAGEALATLTASIFSNLGKYAVAIDEDEDFLVDTGTVQFNSPEGPTTRAYIDYTGATPGTDIVVVSFPANPEVNGTANVTVVAADAASLMVRTYGIGSPSLTLFNPIEGQQYNNFNAVGAGIEDNVEFWVIADDGNGNYTYAPNLEGEEVTVKAYGDFSADGDNIGLDAGSDGVKHEATEIAEATATFSYGIAQGTITINNGGPGAALDVVLTAKNSNTVKTTQMTAGGIDDAATLDDGTHDDVDYVPMLSGSADKLVVGEDVYANGNLIVKKSCYIVLDDGTDAPGTARTAITVAQTDANGNAVKAFFQRVVDGALSSNLEGHLRDSSGDSPAPGSGIWDIAAGQYKDTDYLSDRPPTVNNKARLDGTFTLSSTGLFDAKPDIYLLPFDQIDGNGVDLRVTTDEDNTQITAGSAVTMNITAPGGTLAVDETDSVTITAQGGGQAQLLSNTVFSGATEELTVTATDEDSGTAGIQISFMIYGPCTVAIAEPVTVTMTGICNMSGSNSDTNIWDIQPKAASQVMIVDMHADVEYSDLEDEPIVVTEAVNGEFITGTKYRLLDRTGAVNDLQTGDEYNNPILKSPDFLCQSDWGILNVDPTGGLSGGHILDVTYPFIAAGETDTITCTVSGVGSRSFQIEDIVGSATGVATALEVKQEGPTDVSSLAVNPCPGGEAIIRIGANGTGYTDRDVTISLEGIEGAELRKFDGTAHSGTVILLQPNYDDMRLVVSAPSAGNVIINVEDSTGLSYFQATLDSEFTA